MAEGPRAQLIHIDVDRRLGHEWDEWDGRPLPNQGNYDSPPAFFFAWSAITLALLGSSPWHSSFWLPGWRGYPGSGLLWSALLAYCCGSGLGGACSLFHMPAARSCRSGWPSGDRSSG